MLQGHCTKSVLVICNDVSLLATVLFFGNFLENFPWLKIVKLLICYSSRRIVQETITKHFVAISMRFGGILTGLSTTQWAYVVADL